MKAGAKLRVIGAGLPRTGTLSMYAAMHILGFHVSGTGRPCSTAARYRTNSSYALPTTKCYHGLELACRTGLCKKWDQVLEHDLAYKPTEGIDWHKVMEGYEASFDSPASVSIRFFKC